MSQRQSPCYRIRVTLCSTLGLLLFVLFLAGCEGTATEHAEDEDHHIPPHRPPDLAVTVIELESRPATLLRALSNRDPDAESRFSELRDIVRWIPEIAADSDMSKQPWDEAHAAAQKLETLLPESAEQCPDVFKPDGPAEREWRKLVEVLRRLANQEAASRK